MVIDRNIISWDLVFKSKSYVEILNMLITNYRAMYGADIDLYVNTADGEFLRMLASYLHQFSSMANEVYNSLDVNTAKGTLLDYLMLLSGNLIRKKETSTLVNGKLTWRVDDGFTSDLDFDDNDIFIIQDRLNKMWLVNPKGPIVKDESNPDYIEIIVEAELECLTKGDFILEEPILQMSKNGNFLTNDNIVLSPKTYIRMGSMNETDAQLRARKNESLSYNSKSLTDSIRDDVLNNIHSIQDIKIYNANIDTNYLITRDSTGNIISKISCDKNREPIFEQDGTPILGDDGFPKIHAEGMIIPLGDLELLIPMHDVFVIIKPQYGISNEDIISGSMEDVNGKIEITKGGIVSTTLADIIKRKITLGISTYQGDINDNYRQESIRVNPQFPGYIETIKYYISQRYNPSIEIKVTALDGFELDSTLSRVRSAMFDLARDYTINKTINIAELMNVVNRYGNLDLNNPTFTIDQILIPEGFKTHNNTWYVDGPNDPKITITISED